MTTTLDHFTYSQNSLAVWRLLANSEGTRGRKGGLKQYLVRVDLRTDGKFIVTKFWGKADGQRLSELTSSVVGVYSDYAVADLYARMTVTEKTNGKYWTDYKKSVELVPA